LIALVACATSSRETVWYATAIDGTIVLPSPSPITKRAMLNTTYDVCGPTCVYAAVPASASSTPVGTTTRAPTLSVSRPAKGIASAAPSPCGISSSPVASGLSPRTVWK
jgi:hypothetical protein